MKTAKEILQEIAEREQYNAIVIFTKVHDIALEAMELYASQAVEAERKRISNQLSDSFKKMRFDKNHHLGMGDIRLTMGQQDEILDCINPKTNEP